MKKLTLFLTLCLLCIASTSQAGVIWMEDFADVSDWTVVYDPSGSASISSDGDLGQFMVGGANTEAAFVPRQDASPFCSFDPADKSNYTFCANIDSCTWSTSYDFALDCFGSDYGYLTTAWQVYPAVATTAEVGSISRNLGDLDFDPNTAYIMPKVNMHTGNGMQTIRMDNIYIDYEGNQPIPEPSSMLLFGSGVAGIWLKSRKKK